MKDSDQSIRKRRAGSRTLLPKGGNDRVYTPDALALDIVRHFRPAGRILEPACGGGALLHAMPGCGWCEINKGVDFLACTWIVTNPPYSILTKFLAVQTRMHTSLHTEAEAERQPQINLKLGVPLHSYRYGWAERSADAGYPERYAQRALGQNSKMVHRAYAKKAQAQLPSLEEYEEAKRQAEASGKILVLEHEAEVPKVA